MAPGQLYQVSVTVRNSGTIAWAQSETDRFALGASHDSSAFSPTARNLDTNETVPPGGSRRFYFTLTAPASAGTYVLGWRMTRNGVGFGEDPTKQIRVTWGPDVPGAPVIAWLAPGSVVGSNRPEIRWTGDKHDAYEIHIGYYNVPSSVEGYDSGAVYVPQAVDRASTGPLPPGRAYYVFVRLHNPNGWGPWSAYGNHFYSAGELPDEPHAADGPVGSQWPHSICYNPDRDEYMVAYNDARPGATWTVSYQILDGSGAKVGPEHTIAHSIEGTHEAAVVYNNLAKEYLLAYNGWDGAEEGNLHDVLYIQRVRASDGEMIGTSRLIRSNGYGLRNYTPYLAYSRDDDVYYLAWDDQTTVDEHNIYALRLDGATAANIGGIVDLTDNVPIPCTYPCVIYNPTQREFFVAYQANNYMISPPKWYDCYCQRVNAATGARIGSYTPLIESYRSDEYISVAWDPDLNRYLLTCQGIEWDKTDPRAWILRKSIWGQFVSASGTPIYADGTPSGTEDPFLIIDWDSTGLGLWDPSVVWNPLKKEFLVTCCDMNTNDNFGRRLTESGQPMDLPFKINGSVDYLGNWSPIPVVNNSGDYLIAWYNAYRDVFVRRYRSLPGPLPDSTAPAAVGSLTATPGDQSVTLSWRNPPDDDFAGTMIRYRIGSYPTSPTDGTLLAYRYSVPGSTDTFTHTGLSGGVTYYYALFTQDEVPNYSAAARVTCAPAGPRTILGSTFNTNSGGWSTSVWKSGPYALGVMEWNPTAGNPGGAMRCTGSGGTDNSTRETREGGEMWRMISTLGYDSIRVSCDLKVNSLGGAYYGVGSGDMGCLVDHNDVQEQLTVSYTTDGGATWIELSPWLGRDVLLGYQAFGTRVIDLTGISAVESCAGFGLKFRWQLNTDTDMGVLDNITISGARMEMNAPGITVLAPTNDAHYPANTTPIAVSGSASDDTGVTQITWTSSKGGSGICAGTDYWDASVPLQPGQNLLTFTAHDRAGNTRTDTLMVFYAPDSPVTVAESKGKTNETQVYLSALPVTAVFSDCFYVQDPSCVSGIKVKPYSLPAGIDVGSVVNIAGVVRTDTTGERYIYGSASTD